MGPMPPGPAPTDARYLNRELSWLDFNARVLALAEDADLPLLERVKFAAIFSANLDEFFQVRVAGLKDQFAAGVTALSIDGRTASEQLVAIGDRVRDLVARQQSLLGKLIAAARRRAHRRRGVHGPRRRGPGAPAGRVRRQGVPGPDPARRRPLAPVPLHLRPLAEPRGRDRRSRRRSEPLRPGQDPADAPSSRAPPRRPPVGPARGRRLVTARGALPGDGRRRRLSLPGDAQQRPRSRRRRRGRPPRRRRDRAPTQTIRGSGPPRGRPRHARRHRGHCCSTSSSSNGPT